MPALNGTADAAAVMVNGNAAETNGYKRPSTPTMSLTEYSVNPTTPPSGEARDRLKQQIPEDLLLPNGYPDVSLAFRQPARLVANHHRHSTCA